MQKYRVQRDPAHTTKRKERAFCQIYVTNQLTNLGPDRVSLSNRASSLRLAASAAPYVDFVLTITAYAQDSRYANCKMSSRTGLTFLRCGLGGKAPVDES